MSRVRSVVARAAVLAGLSLTANAAFAVCGYLPGGGESSLQQCFDEWLGPGEVVLSDRLSDGVDAEWVSGDNASTTIVLELAGFSNTNMFGLYDRSSNATLQLFNGQANDGDTRSIVFESASGGGYDVYVNRPNGTTIRTGHFTSLAFGFYLSVPGSDNNPANDATYYSDSGLNTDSADHMYAFQGTGGQFRGQSGHGDQVPGLPEVVEGTVFGPDDYILAWEDLPAAGDGDYQDFVVLVRDVTPVPLPTALWLMASGLIGLAGVARRRA